MPYVVIIHYSFKSYIISVYSFGNSVSTNTSIAIPQFTKRETAQNKGVSPNHTSKWD